MVIPFTRNRDIRGLTEPTLFIKRIQLYSGDKYLETRG
jgi:hypothetical protein